MNKNSASRNIVLCGTLTAIAFAMAACSQETEGEEVEAGQVETGATDTSDAPGEALFDGETLDGWTQTSGVASYHVEDGSIVGTTAVGWPNSFLVPDGEFDDFILTLETRSDNVVNSGVQFRSHFFEDPADGMIGYQVDFDPSPRQWSGGVYHEGVDIWRYSLIRNRECMTAWNATDWNDLRIQAVGDNIKTWVNGTACVDMYDRSHDSGRFGLQVHGIVDEAEAGSITEWRNIRIITGDELEEAMVTTHEAPVEGWLANELSPGEVEQGWWLLWDGDAEVEAAGWPVQGGMLAGTADSDALEFALEDEAQTVSFDFGLEPDAAGEAVYTIAAGSDQGAECTGSFALADESEGRAEDLPRTSFTGALSGEIESGNLSNDTRDRRIYHRDKMNRGRIVLREGNVEHWLNGVQTVIYPLTRCEAFSEPSGDPVITDLIISLQDGSLNVRSVKAQPM